MAADAVDSCLAETNSGSESSTPEASSTGTIGDGEATNNGTDMP